MKGGGQKIESGPVNVTTPVSLPEEEKKILDEFRSLVNISRGRHKSERKRDPAYLIAQEEHRSQMAV